MKLYYFPSTLANLQVVSWIKNEMQFHVVHGIYIIHTSILGVTA